MGKSTHVVLLSERRGSTAGFREFAQSNPDFRISILNSTDDILRVPPIAGSIFFIPIESFTAKRIVLSELLDANPKARIVVLAREHRDDASQVVALLRGGAHGCISRDVSAVEVAAILELVTHGQMAMPYSVANALLSFFDTIRPLASSALKLSRRERDIMRCVLIGESDLKAAEELGISVHTVRVHFKRIYKKLGVHSRVEAIRKFVGNEARDSAKIPSNYPLASQDYEV